MTILNHCLRRNQWEAEELITNNNMLTSVIGVLLGMLSLHALELWGLAPLSSRVATGISWSPLSGLCSVGEL